ncbi:M23 family metallopeptidase [Terrimesophilobacter mesophilus]|uniref:M23 family metallopeptidase n=2 Tax=Terrimesophilobacter mesophilus TaxID=433647 RepID=A0A4R8VAS2_9MICO|nr:M23 family metallopeptidase [Terrimesophilobacter mesophilus]TFB80029.1 M23 family metallopeptidase [Terrimesophilobacter mesophilus]
MSNAQVERRSRTAWWRNRILVTLALLSMVFTGTVASPVADTAWAADYPSWGDVLAARHNVAKKKAEIARIEKLLKQLDANQKATEADAIEKGTLFAKAQDAFDEQDYKTQQYQAQADAAQLKADDSKKRAGQMAARLARTGGEDFSATLFFNGDNAKDLLAQLGMATKISEQSKGLYDRATQDQNTAQSLTDQANVAKDALEVLRDAAQKAQVAAQKAADAAAAALQEQQANNATLQAQLATLKTGQRHIEAQYVKGIQEQWGAGGGAVEISSQGWARPAFGRITSGFGPRVPPYPGVSPFHRGTDIGASCNSPIYAAHSGTVTYAGYYGTYGNFVLIDHGGGIVTGYAHIVNGGTKVHYGQEVVVGQVIAKVGMTGAATGCHLHFEVRINGTAVDAVPFMAARGIRLG